MAALAEANEADLPFQRMSVACLHLSTHAPVTAITLNLWPCSAWFLMAVTLL